MMKNRKKILIISVCLAVLIAALSVATVFAYNISVQYNYGTATVADTLTYSLSGNTLSVSQTSNSVNTDKVDVIVVATSTSATIGGKSATKTVSFEYNDTTYYKSVYTDLTTGDLAVSGTISVTAVVPHHATVTNADETTDTVTYKNEYISSFAELEAINNQEQYNNIFEYFGGALAKTTFSCYIYLLDDITVSSDFTINHPCSINLLNSTLNLTGNLSVSHSFGGSYYLTAAAANASYGLSAGSISIAANKMLTLKTPKAYYKIDTAIASTLTADNYSAIFNYTDYGATLLTDALDFAETFIPATVYDDLILQPMYQTHGVSYSYSTVTSGSGDNAVLADFSGRVVTTAESGALLRNSSDTDYTVRITAVNGDSSAYRDVTVKVIGSSTAAMLTALKNSFISTYADAENDNLLSSDDAYDLYALISNFCRASGFSTALTVTIGESEELPVTDVNAVKIYLNGSGALSQTVQYDATTDNRLENSSGTAVSSMSINCGAVVLSDTLTITLASGAITETFTCALQKSSPAEIVYFLQTTMPPFVTGSNYSLFNLADTNSDSTVDSLYLGSTSISGSLLGLDSISYRLVTISEGVATLVTTSDYFETSGSVLLAPATQVEIPDNLYLEYTFTFDASTTRTVTIPVVETLAGGGEQQFQSNNPFDELFLSSDTNWLIGGTFVVPAADSNMYAKIEIITVNGDVYSSATHKLCAITNSGNNVNSTYYKTVAFTVNTNYVPTSNSTIKVRCTYYDNDASTTTLTQDYTFTIPGIFKCGDNNSLTSGYTEYVFADSAFYNMTISLIKTHFGANADTYVSVLANESEVLLSDSSYASLELDYTSLTAPTSAINLKGLEKLSNVTSIILDNIEISDISAFGDFYNSDLVSLSMANCGLTDAIVFGQNVDSYLCDINLLTVNLSGNAISTTAHLLMRTVTSLNISGQVSNSTAVLTDISGLYNLASLTTLDVSNNGIYSFETLTGFEKLTTAYIYGNIVSASWTNWGTNGLLNVPYYVEITKARGSILHANASSLADTITLLTETATQTLFSSGGDLTLSMQEGSLALNSLVIKTQLYSSLERTSVEGDITGLYVKQGVGYVSGGINTEETTIYSFAFYNVATSSTSNSMCFIDSQHTAITTVSGSIASPVTCSIIITVLDENNVALASREYFLTVYYGIS